jgi:hypothetical protein
MSLIKLVSSDMDKERAIRIVEILPKPKEGISFEEASILRHKERESCMCHRDTTQAIRIYLL